jgi:hypothetical protein
MILAMIRLQLERGGFVPSLLLDGSICDDHEVSGATGSMQLMHFWFSAEFGSFH